MFMDKKTQYCQDVSSSLLPIDSMQSQIPKKSLYGCQQTDSNVYIERSRHRANTIFKENKAGG